MKIVFMNGGLGNQLFQYIFFRWLEITTGESCVLDDSPFFGARVPHNGYELEQIFGVRPKRLSEFFDADTWEWLVEQRVGVNGIAQQLLDTGMDLPMVHEKDASICFQGRVITCEGAAVPSLSGDGYYQGYWLGNYFLDKIREPLQAELVFPPLASQQNRRYAEQIAAAESVGIHIRRGDMARLGKAASPAFLPPRLLVWKKYGLRHSIFCFPMIYFGVGRMHRFWDWTRLPDDCNMCAAIKGKLRIVICS